MIIISQDKKQIINWDNITRISIEEPENDNKNKKYYIGADTNSAESMVWELGEYDTEERAKEVLQEIIDAYKGKLLIKFQTILHKSSLERLRKQYKNQAIIYDQRSEVNDVKNVNNVIYYVPEK